ncbi:MAG: single-stranded DNA-binding protein [Atribacterota bacterium]|nr:single-stranded DNA-binding protein [Candidatus Atribacteria bacterium]
MAGDINYFFGIGNLTRDPEQRFTPQGTAVSKFNIAMNRKYQGKNGLVNETTYIAVAAWSKLAEVCTKYLRKGSRVAVVGELRSNSWEDRNGNKRVSYEIRAISVQFLSAPRKGTEEVQEIGENIPPEEEIVPFSYDGGVGENALGDLEDITPDGKKDVSPF